MKKNFVALKQLLNSMLTLALPKLAIINARLKSKGVVLSQEIPVDI